VTLESQRPAAVSDPEIEQESPGRHETPPYVSARAAEVNSDQADAHVIRSDRHKEDDGDSMGSKRQVISFQCRVIPRGDSD
jgi:hypothetical protein